VVVGTLGSHGTEPAAIDLLSNLLDDPSPQVRISALSSLGFLQQPRALPKIRLLANDDNPRVRAWVAIALGRIPALEPADPATSAVLDQLAARLGRRDPLGEGEGEQRSKGQDGERRDQAVEPGGGVRVQCRLGLYGGMGVPPQQATVWGWSALARGVTASTAASAINTPSTAFRITTFHRGGT
jgi:hypothetical protein